MIEVKKLSIGDILRYYNNIERYIHKYAKVDPVFFNYDSFMSQILKESIDLFGLYRKDKLVGVLSSFVSCNDNCKPYIDIPVLSGDNILSDKNIISTIEKALIDHYSCLAKRPLYLQFNGRLGWIKRLKAVGCHPVHITYNKPIKWL